MQAPTHKDWANHLRSIAAPPTPTHTLPPLPTSDSPFRDDLGHTRPVDTPFFAWRCANANQPIPSSPAQSDQSPDVLLWAALTDPLIDPLEIIQGPLAAPTTRAQFDQGSLFGQQHGDVPIEVWTEQELSSAHALAWLTRTRKSNALTQTLNAVADWYAINLQPDNATNHPWAIHLFIDRSITLPNPADRAASKLYAETLLHNCQVNMGRPDTFSAHILLDAADFLDQFNAN